MEGLISFFLCWLWIFQQMFKLLLRKEPQNMLILGAHTCLILFKYFYKFISKTHWCLIEVDMGDIHIYFLHSSFYFPAQIWPVQLVTGELGHRVTVQLTDLAHLRYSHLHFFIIITGNKEKEMQQSPPYQTPQRCYYYLTFSCQFIGTPS